VAYLNSYKFILISYMILDCHSSLPYNIRTRTDTYRRSVKVFLVTNIPFGEYTYYD
jgi:hypothetical protein